MRLVDKGSGPRGFDKLLGLRGDGLAWHLERIGYYRTYLEVYKEIDRIRSMDISNAEKRFLVEKARERFK